MAEIGTATASAQATPSNVSYEEARARSNALAVSEEFAPSQPPLPGVILFGPVGGVRG